ncbi:MAG TPA: DNA mismatch repair protein MutS [Firmicutes bacterium]|nr:DNA mismatch repair protein MutS [Bacillota bacterium]
MTPTTPMMKQYREIKNQHPDAILFFRLGDFYEMFFEDALLASRELDIVLTGREASGERAPMCGVPYHAAEQYIAILVGKGYKVAICEQMEDPKLAKGLVKRQVVRVITPGTFVSSGEAGARYMAALCELDGAIGISFMEATEGSFTTMQMREDNRWDEAWGKLVLKAPAECIVPADSQVEHYLKNRAAPASGWRFALTPVKKMDLREAEQLLLRHFKVATLAGYGCDGMPAAIVAAGMLLRYLYETQLADALQIRSLSTEAPEEYVTIDPASWRNLDVAESSVPGKNTPTLLGVLDATVTRMGKRLLREWLEKPLRDLNQITYRNRAVAELVADEVARKKLRAIMAGFSDLPRLVSRVAANVETPRDILNIGKSLRLVPRVKEILERATSEALKEAICDMDELRDLAEVICAAIREDAPSTLKEGGVIKEGYNAELDRIVSIGRNARQYLASLEASEREATGIRSLKIGYNRVFGYYIEVTNANAHLVPARYQRKQTLRSAERYVTDELKELESTILSAEEKAIELEQALYAEVKQKVLAHIEQLQLTGKAIAMVDVLAALAEVAVRNDYAQPELCEEPVLEIRDGRHPVVESVLGPGKFVPNDVRLDAKSARLAIVTGPNMGGKSTYLRQVALIVIMAQIGSFVPARKARIGLVDRIFARIGAHDDLAAGQSTFMVEMSEVANILNNATERSLVLLDELGRGTGTFDGLSLAWAVAEYLHDQVRCNTLMATHFREIIELGRQLEAAVNLHVAVKEDAEGIKFLWKVLPGGAAASYGVEVAKLAGLPADVTERAAEILARLESEAPSRSASARRKKSARDLTSQLRLA